MKAYKIYKHLSQTNVFGIAKKIKEIRKPKKDVNKNRQRKN
jgi:hypothetical protein|tara:strand:+ start:358 stop:480 length:123 start_codon:yes stop_codon:yes gene_type:complete